MISTQTRTQQAASTQLHSGFLNEGRQRPDFRVRGPVCSPTAGLRGATIKVRFPACLETSKRPATLGSRSHKLTASWTGEAPVFRKATAVPTPAT